jgi:hypothetical protein
VLAKVALDQLAPAVAQFIAASENEIANDIAARSGDFSFFELHSQRHPLTAHRLLNPEACPRARRKARIGLQTRRVILLWTFVLRVAHAEL